MSVDSIGQDLLNCPMGEMISQMALSIAEAQFELDQSSMRAAEFMSGQAILRNEDDEIIFEEGTNTPETVPTTIKFGGDDLSMMELGFVPTFYQFLDTIIEVKIAVKIQRTTVEARRERSRSVAYERTSYRGGAVYSRNGKAQISVSAVDAVYSSRYNYSAEGSSYLRTKLVPIPPPAVLEERIRLQLEEREKLKEIVAPGG